MHQSAITFSIKSIFVGLGVIALSGCFATGAKYRPIVDGGDLTHYEEDLAACQEVAKQRAYVNEDVKADAAIGAVTGALIGLTESKEDALGGAIIGGGISAAGTSYEAKDERKHIVINCMRARNYNVVG